MGSGSARGFPDYPEKAKEQKRKQLLKAQAQLQYVFRISPSLVIQSQNEKVMINDPF